MTYIIEACMVVLPAVLIFSFFKGKKVSLDGILNKNSKFFYKLYNILVVVPIVSHQIGTIKLGLYRKSNDSEAKLRVKSVFVFLVAFTLSITFCIVMLKLWKNDIFTAGILIMISIYLYQFVISRFIERGTKFLYKLVEFIQDLKHYFHIHNMVDEAIRQIEDSSDDLEIQMQTKKLYEALQEEELMQRYLEVCPEKFLKLIGLLSYLTKEFDDVKILGLSLYIKNLNYIIEDIQTEIIFKKSLHYWVKGMQIICIIPIFTPTIIENWVKSNFTMASGFFEGGTGLFLKLLVISIDIICYFVLVNLEMTFQDREARITVKREYWENKLLKIGFMRIIIRALQPKRRSKEYINIIKLLEDAGSYMKIDFLYLRKFLCFTASFIFVVSFCYSSHKLNIDAIKSNAYYDTKGIDYAAMSGLGDEGTNSTEIMKKDNDILSGLGTSSIDKNKVKQEVLAKYKSMDPKVTNEAVNRIIAKINGIKKEHMYWYEFLIAFIVSLVLMEVPVWILKLQKGLRQANMQNEVFLFHTIVLLLMNNELTTVDLILEWMERFSDIFYNPIRKCINNFNKEGVDALEVLKAEVSFKPFQRVIDNLIMAEEIGIKDAFDSLETDRQGYKEERKEVSKRIVEERISAAKMIGFIPFTATLCLELIMPVVISTFTILNDSLTNMNMMNW